MKTVDRKEVKKLLEIVDSLYLCIGMVILEFVIETVKNTGVCADKHSPQSKGEEL